MKKIILLFVAMAMSAAVTALSAAEPQQKKTKDEIKKVEFVTDIDCEGCTKKIMAFMPTQKGVKDVEIDLPRKVVTVSYNEKKTSEENLIKEFAKIKVKAKKLTTPTQHKE